MSTRRSTAVPIWTQPAPGSRRPRFTREQIAEVALRIADAEGFEALSMRRIAAELGAGTMTLYHYVRTKEDLIALMNDAIMAEVLIPDEELPVRWRDAMRAIAVSSYRAFQRHPWALEALRGARFGPNGMRHVEQSLAAVANSPFDLQGKLDVLGAVDDYVFGHVYRANEATASSGDGPEGARASRALFEFAEAQFATGAFPHLAKLLEGGERSPGWAKLQRSRRDAGRFARGLEVLLDGFEARARAARSRRRRR